MENQNESSNLQELGILRKQISKLQEKEHEWGLAQNELRKFKEVIKQSSMHIIITDPDGIIEFVNPAFSQSTGFSQKEAIGKNASILQSGKTSPKAYKDIWKKITSGKTWKGDLENKKKDGSLYWERATISPVFNDDDEITNYCAVMENITERKQTEKYVKYISLQDILTDTYNQTFFKEEMSRLGKGRSHPISILVAYVNNLKAINNQHGPQVGDVALQSIAKIIKSSFRPDDIVARTEDDKFAILLLDSSNSVAQKASKRIYTRIENHNKSDDCIVPLSISIGWATAKRSKTLDNVFKIANEKIDAVLKTRKK